MKLFVYGTLKHGKHAHHYLKGATFLGQYSIDGTMYGTETRAYPIVKLGTGGIVHGELYEITDDMLVKMDQYEGHPHLYKRTLVQDVWVYEYQGDVGDMHVIESGIYS